MKSFKDGLWQILWHRYWKMLLLVLVATLGLSVTTGYGAGAEWQQRKDYWSGTDGQKIYQDTQNAEQQEREKIASDAEYAAKYGQDAPESFDSFDDFLQEFLAVYKVYPKENLIKKVNAQDSIYFPAILAFVAGFLLFFLDLKTGFNSLLFSLGETRKKIYWRKVLLFAVSLSLIYILCHLVYNTLFMTQIAEPYLNGIRYVDLLPSLICEVLKRLVFFAAGVLLGIICGDWLMTAVAAVASYLLLKEAINSTLAYFSAIFGNQHEEDFIGTGLGLWRGLFAEASYLRIPWLTVLLFGGALLFCLLLGSVFYKYLSLEEDGEFILLPWLRRPLWLLFVAFATYSYSHNFVYANDFQGVFRWSLAIRNFIVVFIGAVLLACFIFYRRLPFQRKIISWWNHHREEKVQRKIKS